MGHCQAAESGLLLHMSTAWSVAVIQITKPLHVHLVFGRPKGLPPASFVFNHPVIPRRALASGYRAFSRPSHWPATSACEVAVALMHVANSMLPADSRASLSAPSSACQWVCHRRRCACTRSRLFALCSTSRAATTTAATMRRRGCSGSRAGSRAATTAATTRRRGCSGPSRCSGRRAQRRGPGRGSCF